MDQEHSSQDFLGHEMRRQRVRFTQGTEFLHIFIHSFLTLCHNNEIYIADTLVLHLFH